MLHASQVLSLSVSATFTVDFGAVTALSWMFREDLYDRVRCKPRLHGLDKAPHHTALHVMGQGSRHTRGLSITTPSVV